MIEPERFIVVDDNRTNNLICEFAIRKYRKEAETSLFTEPETALQNIQKNYGLPEGKKFTVLFLDINMPSMTGWEFLEKFKDFGEEIWKHFIIYILTSSVDERDKEKAGAEPLVAGFISKPLTVNSIQQIVESLQGQSASD